MGVVEFVHAAVGQRFLHSGSPAFGQGPNPGRLKTLPPRSSPNRYRPLWASRITLVLQCSINKTFAVMLREGLR